MSEKLITEIELIQKYAKAKDGENWRFRSYVKGHLDMGDAALDTLVRDTADEVMEQIDCTTCGHCCRALQIVVDDFDLSRLAKGLGQNAAALKKQYTKRADDGAMVFSSQPCPFLEGNICTVYEHRPRACRDFPFLHEKGFRFRMYMFLDNTYICPIVYNTCELLKKRLPFRRSRR